VAEVIGVSRSNLIERMREQPNKRIGRPPLPDDKLVAEIKAVIAEQPTYGYRRVHAILKRQALAAGLALGSGGRSSATVFGRWLHLATCLSGETQLLSGARVYQIAHIAKFIPH
jgi:hypothetical protein